MHLRSDALVAISQQSRAVASALAAHVVKTAHFVPAKLGRMILRAPSGRGYDLPTHPSLRRQRASPNRRPLVSARLRRALLAHVEPMV